jgi:hypothetical protein
MKLFGTLWLFSFNSSGNINRYLAAHRAEAAGASHPFSEHIKGFLR